MGNDSRKKQPPARSKRAKKKSKAPLLLAAALALGVFLVLRPRLGAEAPEETEPSVQLVVEGTQTSIPQALLDLERRNPETRDFVERYPGTASQEDMDITQDYTPGEIPHFLQWDGRWGYLPYGGTEPEDMIGLSGCGPTALSMVVVGLTGDTEANPAAVAKFAAEAGYATEDSGTAWALMSEGCEEFGITAHEVPLWEETMIQELENSPIICAVGPGDFTDVGHFLVLIGYRDGSFQVLDPNSKANSQRSWSYQELAPQLRAMWAYEENQ